MNNQEEKPPAPDVADNLTKVIKDVLELTSAHKVAHAGPMLVLLAYGALMIPFAVILRMFPQARLGLSEFSVLVASGALLFIAGAAMRLSQFKVQTEVAREIRQQAFRTLNAQQTAISGAKVIGGEKAQL